MSIQSCYFSVQDVEKLWFWMRLRQVSMLCQFCLLSCVLGVSNSPMAIPGSSRLTRVFDYDSYRRTQPACLVYLWQHPRSHFTKLLIRSLFFGPCHCSCIFLPRLTNKEIRKATPLQIGSQEYQINHHPNAKKHCEQFVELARCERVMTTQAEFHFSWAYTFSATPRSLRIWATHPPRETGCDPAPPAQLNCVAHLPRLLWVLAAPSHILCTTTSWNVTVTKLI